MLTKRFKFLYSLGDLSISMPLAIVSFYGLFFMTNVAGMPAGDAGLAVLIGRLWDSVNDPIFGMISDRIKSPKGRRRVVLQYAAIPIGIAFISLFWVPPFSGVGLIIYYSLAIIVFDTLFTMVHVSFNALTPAITQDYDETSSLNGYRMGMSIFGGLFAVIMATALGLFITDERSFYLVLGIVIGLLTIIPIYIAYIVTEPYDSTAPMDEDMSPVEAMKATVNNKAFLLLMGLYLFSWTSASIIATVLIFFANYYLEVPSQANFFILVSQTSAILFMPFWVWMSQRFDKRSSFIWGSASWIVILLLLYAVQPDQVGLTYLLAGLGGAGVATAFFLPWAMIPDVIEEDLLKTGMRREGAYYSFAAFFQKLGTGIVIFIMGIVLESQGYISPTDDVPAPIQPESAVQAIRICISVLPAILLVFAIICAYYYPITRQTHAKVQAELAEQGLTAQAGD